MYQALVAGIALVQEAYKTWEQLKQGPRGMPGKNGVDGKSIVGPQGARGPQGIPGEPGTDGESLPVRAPASAAEVADAVLASPRFLKFLKKTAKDGKDGQSPELDMVVELVLKRLDTNGITDKQMQAIEARIAEIRNYVAMHTGSSGGDKRKGGGGDTVVAGNNIVFGVDANGNIVINALGGTSGVNVTTQYALTAVQSGADVTIDLTQLTNWATFANVVVAYRNNVPQTEGAAYNFTVAGSTLTIFNADAAEVFNMTYAYT